MSEPTKRQMKALRHFVEHHLDGWGHREWESLLEILRDEGLVSEGQEEEVGRRLEYQHVLVTLERLSLPGMGPKRREAVAAAYGNVWELRQASPEAVASIPAVPHRLAENLVEALR